MPRKTYLPDKIHNHNFDHLAKMEKDPKARIRMLARNAASPRRRNSDKHSHNAKS